MMCRIMLRNLIFIFNHHLKPSSSNFDMAPKLTAAQLRKKMEEDECAAKAAEKVREEDLRQDCEILTTAGGGGTRGA